MKLTKKLLPAFGMLLLSACMMVTSTFAWFSMNTEVEATGMTVTAQGEQVYLQIVREGDSFTPGAAQTTATAKTASAALLPTNVCKTFDKTTPTAYDGTTLVWVSAIGKNNSKDYKDEGGNDHSDGYMPVGDYENVTDKAGYYLKNTFKIRLDPTAGASASAAELKVRNIKITGTSDKTFSKCLSVLVVCTYDNDSTDSNPAVTQGDLWNYNTQGTFAHATSTKDTLTTTVLKKETEATVDIYVFFNGDSEYCTLAELAAATGESYSVEVSFTCATA